MAKVGIRLISVLFAAMLGFHIINHRHDESWQALSLRSLSCQARVSH